MLMSIARSSERSKLVPVLPKLVSGVAEHDDVVGDRKAKARIDLGEHVIIDRMDLEDQEKSDVPAEDCTNAHDRWWRVEPADRLYRVSTGNKTASSDLKSGASTHFRTFSENGYV